MKRVSAAAAMLVLGLGTGCTPVDPEDPVASARDPLGEGEIVEVYVVLIGPSAIEAASPATDFGTEDVVKRTRARLIELSLDRDALRPQLVALGAVVIDELARVANAFHVRIPGGALPKVRAMPGVVRVEPVPFFEIDLHSALPVVGVPALWSSGTSLHGEGIRIGILDTGVDYLHADFAGVGDPAAFEADDPTIVEPGSFPTARVIGGHDFCGDDYNPNGGSATPVPDDDPIDCNGHGTHVGGIAAGGGVLGDGTSFAGPYDQSLELTAFRVAPGVAPKALLYALKIFGCDGGTQLVASGLERAADPDQNGDMSDRLDVVNASLGSPYGTPNLTHIEAIDSFTAAGGLFVASAGNEGSTFFVTGSPGSAPNALSVAASVDNTFIALEVTAPVGLVGDYAAIEASFTEPLVGTGPVAGEVARAEPKVGCEPLDNAAEIAGRIALIDRGDCLFYDKLVNAEAAGAIGAIVVNNNFDDPFVMGGTGGGETSGIPGVMIRLLDGDLIKAALPSGVEVILSNAPFTGEGSELVAGLSSRGPSVVGNTLKPEIAAPGVAIDSASVGSGIDPTSKQGTSMAAPFVTGGAALVREAFPSLTPFEVKAQLMNTAARLADVDSDAFPVSMQGSGRLDVTRAVAQHVRAHVDGGEGEVGVSFGAIASATVTTIERTIVVDNRGSETVTYAVSAPQVHPLDGVTVTVSPTELTLAPNESATLTLILALDPTPLGQPAPDSVTPLFQSSLPRQFLNEADGHVVLEDQSGPPGEAGDQSMVVPYYGIVRAASALAAAPPQGCTLPEGEVVAVPIVGDSAHPNPTITAFELGIVDPAVLGSAPELDLRAVGVATDYATRSQFGEVSVHFGVAVDGDWTTPAQGGYSILGVAIDGDNDGSPDRAIVVEPLNDSEPFVDVLASRTYDTSSCNFTGEGCPAIGSKRYVNLVPANEADTSPFENSVLVLSAFAADLGLTEDNTVLRYFAFTAGLVGVQEQTAPATFDVRLPRIDPARSAPVPGLPLYHQGDPVVVHLGPRDAGGLVPDLLLLHHNGEARARFESVALSIYGPDPLALTHTLAAHAPAHSRVAGKVEVRNDGPTPVYDAVLRGTIQGTLQASFLAPSHGQCEAAPLIDCEIGVIAPGETRSVTFELETGDPGTATLNLGLVTASGCTTPLDVTVALDDGNSKPPTLDVGGGCGCRVGGSPRVTPWWVVLLALLVKPRRWTRAACASSRARRSAAGAPARARAHSGCRAPEA